jgi:hypothetical protein
MAATCPPTCPWLSTPGAAGACYVSSGFQRFAATKLDEEAASLDPAEVIRTEARLIAKSFRGGPVPQDGPEGGGRALRIHVAGDVEGATGAESLAAAAENWMQRGGQRPWSYTHRWADVKRTKWGPVSVLASVEDPTDMRAAARQGYAPALVVEQFPSDTAFAVKGWKVVPCPFETRGISCVECKLCWRGDDLLASKTAIGFQAHGQGVHRAAVGHE